MDASTYKIIHIFSLLILFFAFGGLTMGARTSMSRVFNYKRLHVILHGLGLVFLLISGFGLLAKLSGGAGALPLWVIIKLIIWLSLGIVLTFILRKPQFNKYSWIVLLGMGLTAAVLGLTKPF